MNRAFRSVAIEWAFAAAVWLSVLYSTLHLIWYGNLPQPFFLYYWDSYMDGINTAWYAYNEGTYDYWQSIYPPFAFLWLLLTTKGSCYAADAASARDCDWILPLSMQALMLINALLVFAIFRRTDRRTAVPRTIAVALGFPTLFALERLNLIIPTFTFFLLAYGPLLQSARLRWIAAAISFNFKPYLVSAIFAVLLHRRWRWFEGAIVAIVGVWAISYVIFGAGSPVEVISNTLAFAQASRATDWNVAYYATSYNSLIGFFDSNFPIMVRLGSRQMEYLPLALQAILLMAQTGVILASVATFLRPVAVPRIRMIGLAVMFSMATAEAGGYAYCFALVPVFMEKWKGSLRIISLLSAYVLSLSADIVIAPLRGHTPMVSFLGDRVVDAAFGVSIGSMLRPMFMLIIMICLSIQTILDVVTNYREAGIELSPIRRWHRLRLTSDL